jgi:hypothetical protein
MEHYKSVVMDYLQADKAVFVNAEYCVRFPEPGDPEKLEHHCACDAVAVDLRHGAVYLCETAFEHKLQSLMKKLSAWTRNWEAIKSALQQDCKVPASWRVHVWLFVPRDSIQGLDGKLEQLRHTIGSKFKVKITALEDVQPWQSSNWERSEAAWETRGHRTLA